MDVVSLVVLYVVSVDVVTNVPGVVDDSVQFALPVLQLSHTLNGSISRDKRKHSRLSVR